MVMWDHPLRAGGHIEPPSRWEGAALDPHILSAQPLLGQNHPPTPQPSLSQLEREVYFETQRPRSHSEKLGGKRDVSQTREQLPAQIYKIPSDPRAYCRK